MKSLCSVLLLSFCVLNLDAASEDSRSPSPGSQASQDQYVDPPVIPQLAQENFGFPVLPSDFMSNTPQLQAMQQQASLRGINQALPRPPGVEQPSVTGPGPHALQVLNNPLYKTMLDESLQNFGVGNTPQLQAMQQQASLRGINQALPRPPGVQQPSPRKPISPLVPAAAAPISPVQPATRSAAISPGLNAAAEDIRAPWAQPSAAAAATSPLTGSIHSLQRAPLRSFPPARPPLPSTAVRMIPQGIPIQQGFPPAPQEDQAANSNNWDPDPAPQTISSTIKLRDPEEVYYQYILFFTLLSIISLFFRLPPAASRDQNHHENLLDEFSYAEL